MEPLPPTDRFRSHRPHDPSLNSAPEAPTQGPKLEIHGLGSHLPSARRLDACNPPVLPTPRSLDLWFDDSLTKITHLVTSNTPTKPPFFYSKPWWTPELTQLRCIHHHTSRLMRKNQAWPVWLGTHISRLSNLTRECTGPSVWRTSTRGQSGMLERLQPAEPQIVSPHSRTPDPPPKSTIHFYNIFSLLDPLLLLP